MRGVMMGWCLAVLTGCALGSDTDTSSSPLTLGDGGSTVGDSATSTGGSTFGIASVSNSSGGSSTAAADASTGGGPPSVIIECDDAWELDPSLPAAGEELWAGFSADEPHVEIGIVINGVLDGPLIIDDDFYDTNGGAPWTWWWTIGGIEPGMWTLEFVRDKLQPGGPIVEGTCIFEVL